MPYAHRAGIFDADTHMMERPDWIASFADPDIRERLAPFVGGDEGTMDRVEDALARFDQRRQDRAAAEAADREFMAMKFKGWHGLGAFDADERRHANELLGFESYIVFPTPAFDQIIAMRGKDDEVFHGGVKALNRGLKEFCSVAPAMLGTAYVPFGTGPERASAFLEDAIRDGFRIVLLDTIPPPGQNAFSHPDYDPLWARIEEAGLAVVLHIGATGAPYRPVPAELFNNGKSVPRRPQGDAAPNAMSYMGMHYNAELFLSGLIFDGVLERFPGLRIGVVELGASWIISWMQRLDQAHRAFRRLQDLADVKMKPSEYVQRQIKVTPFAGEDIGWILGSGGEDLLMFASDYPHHEGTDDPIGRFERTMDGVPEAVRAKFYADNCKALLGR
jgi:predicted TIM-barrel fold metal-dependent hydrolase